MARWLRARPALGRFALAAACLVADAAAKGWASRALAGRGSLWVLRPWLSLELIHNHGVTLGLGAGHPLIWTLVGVAAVPVLAVALARARRGVAGLALMLGGAAGNLLSRLAAGTVADFLHLWFWPGIFNLADVFLRVGALLAVIGLLRAQQGQGEQARAR